MKKTKKYTKTLVQNAEKQAEESLQLYIQAKTELLKTQDDIIKKYEDLSVELIADYMIFVDYKSIKAKKDAFYFEFKKILGSKLPKFINRQLNLIDSQLIKNMDTIVIDGNISNELIYLQNIALLQLVNDYIK